ncbi:MAG TPA: hypothetical protein VFT87_04180 [Candidatus Saccharimonadales bacterium]|nr:hypothetical protein [Candidatus Saccharimonadales bacterium]
MFKNRKSKIIVTVAVLLVTVLGIFLFTSYINQPKNLGPNLEYLGKRHTGCPLPLPLGYLLLCSSEPGEEYYFGTDMSREELRGYFKGADSVTSENLVSGTGAKYSWVDVGFTTKSGNFTFFFYDNKQGVLETYSLNKTNKKNIISIDKEDYQEAKKAL